MFLLGGVIMPRGDGTGPDGKGPKKTNKGWPARDGRGCGRGGGAGNCMQGKRRIDNSKRRRDKS